MTNTSQSNTSQANTSLIDRVSGGLPAAGPVQLWVFHSYQKSCSFIFPNGAKAEFINGKFYTPDEGLALILTQEIIVNRSPYFFIKPGEETIMSDDLDPTVKLKKQLRAEIMQELYQEAMKITMAASSSPGDYDAGKLKVQNTRDIESVTAGADQTTGAKLANIAQMLGVGGVVPVVPAAEAAESAAVSPIPAQSKLDALKASVKTA